MSSLRRGKKRKRSVPEEEATAPVKHPKKRKVTPVEVFEDRRRPPPDRRKFYREVMKTKHIMLSESCTRKQKDDAGRRAVELVLLRQELMKNITDVSTYLKAKTQTS